MSVALIRTLSFILQAVSNFYIFVLVMRFLLQSTKADYYNPISQFIVRATNPILSPLRRWLPKWRSIDLASLLIALIFIATQIVVILWLHQINFFNALALMLWSGIGLLCFFINLYFYAIIALVIMSWITPGNHHPAVVLLYQITAPIMAPIHKILPAVGGLDFSPMIAILGISAIKMGLLQPLVMQFVPYPIAALLLLFQ